MPSYDQLRVQAMAQLMEILKIFEDLKNKAKTDQDKEDLDNLESVFIGTKETLEQQCD